MFKFYLQVWLFWVFRMIVVSLILTLIASFLITLLLYLKQGLPPFNEEIYEAVLAIYNFWVLLLLNFTIPIALFINAKYLFNHCIDGISLKLLSCPKDSKGEIIDIIGYGDIVKVWRKWLLLIVWNTAVIMLISVVISYLFTSYESIFDWFSVYLLYTYILMAGFFSIVLLTSRCKSVRMSKC